MSIPIKVFNSCDYHISQLMLFVHLPCVVLPQNMSRQVVTHLTKWVTEKAKKDGYLGDQAAKELHQLITQRNQIGNTAQVRAAFPPTLLCVIGPPAAAIQKDDCLYEN